MEISAMSILDYNFGIEFNPEIHDLGKLCSKNHRYQGLEVSLRLKANGQCCLCKREYRQKKDELLHPDRVARKKEFHQKEDKPVSAERFPFNSQSHQLGNLCKERHNYDGTGKTLRKKTKNGLGGGCIACEREQYQAKAALRIAEQHKTQSYVKDCKCDSCKTELQRRADQRLITQKVTTKAWLERNPDYYKDWYNKNRDERRAKNREYDARNRERVRLRKQAYREANREQFNETARRWRQTPHGKLATKTFKQLRRARKKKPGSIPYSRKQWQDRKQYFNMRCAYCEASNDLTLEHVIPLCDSRGFDNITNVVPACLICNCKSKLTKKMAHWYPSQPSFTIERFEKILSILGEDEIKAILEDFDL
jgi:hypothetical protein